MIECKRKIPRKAARRLANDNKGFINAGKAKKDEFYTQLTDIEKEMRYYRDYFKGRIVFCNCDDPYESNFFKYFAMNFNVLGLKKLIATCYCNSPIFGMEIDLFDGSEEPIRLTKKKAVEFRIAEIPDMNGDGAIDLADTELLIRKRKPYRVLKGDANYPAGDFRAKECIELLKEADVVVTNPPFSLFREYVAQLMEYKKDFIIIGNQNAITYKAIFPLIKDNKMWYGASIHSHGRDFRVPDNYPLQAYEFRTDEHGNKFINVKGVRWFTNVDYEQRHEDMILYKKYTPEEYPKYDNYDAIEVGKMNEIPVDYDGVMGVPISFIDKYNPEQFEIIGQTHSGDKTEQTESLRTDSKHRHRGRINGKEKYARILIRRKQSPQK